ncbi:hypothetical protein [Chryseobacterium sp. SL1]|uniref:hypothetical protein n=1 Tax=Chryseobacterium sp. SL1 TaxID=2995159 RepID=UPI0022769FEF|nr:hypothetical protein [Chryseobacterium sp. SL1]MCY1662562.1 hypothetical protein [Chryseobacterium sp. SL1]
MDIDTFSILNAISVLEQCKEELIDAMFDVAFNGELKQSNYLVGECELFYFSRELSDSLDDPNVQRLIKIIDSLEMKFLNISVIQKNEYYTNHFKLN